MTLAQTAVTLAAVLAIAVGQVLFKFAARAGAASGVGFPWDLANAWMAAALAVYGVATLLWVWVLRSAPLNIAYPFMGLAFLAVPVMAWLVLGEPIDWRHFAGGMVIIAGIALVSWR